MTTGSTTNKKAPHLRAGHEKQTYPKVC